MPDIQRLTTRLALAAACALPWLASATPVGTLSFVQPTAAPVGPHDDIAVWLRLTSPVAFSVGSAGASWTGLDPLPTTGFWWDSGSRYRTGTFDRITSVMAGTGYGCVGSFWPACTTDQYVWAWGDFGVAPGRAFSIGAGESVDYLFGTFRPIAGGAAPGEYTLPVALFYLQVTGEDADGQRLVAYPEVASTCEAPGGQPCNAYFTRTVQAARNPVPEPAGVGWLALGLALGGWRLLPARQRSAARRRASPAG